MFFKFRINPLVKFYLKRSFKRRNLNIIFFGTDEFSIGPLKALKFIQNELIEDLAVVCGQPIHNKKLHSAPVVEYAVRNRIPQLDWNDFKTQKSINKYDVAVVASFGHFIPSSIIELFPRGTVNIHPSLLPRWRGPAPIIHTVLAGDQYTGITFLKLSKKKFDIGKILYQRKYEVPRDFSSDELTGYLSRKAGELLPQILEDIDNLRVNAHAQDENLKTHAPKVNKSHGFIDFKRMSCSYVVRLFKALPNKIGIHAVFNGKRVKFENITAVQDERDSDYGVQPGCCSYSKEDNILWIKCESGWIGTDLLKVELKKKSISAHSFYNGYIVDKKSGRPPLNAKFEAVYR